MTPEQVSQLVIQAGGVGVLAWVTYLWLTGRIERKGTHDAEIALLRERGDEYKALVAALAPQVERMADSIEAANRRDEQHLKSGSS